MVALLSASAYSHSVGKNSFNASYLLSPSQMPFHYVEPGSLLDISSYLTESASLFGVVAQPAVRKGHTKRCQLGTISGLGPAVAWPSGRRGSGMLAPCWQ